jgi:glycosyltransferase involved in cell wall biosynthesis
MKETTPLVSVLMPVYNGMPYLPLAVESILNQSFRDFEFIIVDDCSNDDSLKYLRTITDERMVLVPLPENKGVTGALQEGMNRVRGKYVARLDADDVAKPHRLQAQVNFLESHSDVGLLGSNF